MTTTDERATTTDTPAELPSRTAQVPRSRGALSGVLLIVLGAWGALIPFVGPYFNVSYTPDTAWHWTAARGWLEVLPGAVAFVGGMLSLLSARRGVISVGAWLGVAAGAWFVIGRGLSEWWNIGSPGVPAGNSSAVHAGETLVMFTGLGALIVFVAASAVGRLSVTTVRDARVAQRRAVKAARRDRRDRNSEYERGRTDGLAEAQSTATRTSAEQAQTDTRTAPAREQEYAPGTTPTQQHGYAPGTVPAQQHDYAPGTTPAQQQDYSAGASAPAAPPPARERPVEPR